VPGGVFTALTGMVLLFLPVWAVATAIFPAIEFEYEDLFDDLNAIFQGWKKRPGHFAELQDWLEKATGLPPVRKFAGWFSPRKHRWNLVVLVAVVMGVSLVLVEALAEGLSPNLGRVVLVITVYIGIEGAGVALGYALLGKYLGIYREERSGGVDKKTRPDSSNRRVRGVRGEKQKKTPAASAKIQESP
jgi:hypothetical protein